MSSCTTGPTHCMSLSDLPDVVVADALNTTRNLVVVLDSRMTP